MKYLCPLCRGELRKRANNSSGNIKLRSIESKRDRFVCGSCEKTFGYTDVLTVSESESELNW